ncbi:DNA ligase D-like protein (predicted polymerase) [Pseudonocardia sediminis]|uniref:DNA ligase D-like protein (Predicted polymerase) n=1 Tax=Pseudonocardia sediminis TaxID=1397368 RepID=A0A4Q7UU76_PSEST|nr:ATP-dependent DNA ligase [Pseudonocardia sediminis]RZT85286.1 DNA ligase D-like protein (predicted polymerase) [Pseudonocardia sediminis]
MSRRGVDDVRDGVELTNLDQPVFDGAEATKRDLVDYLDAVAGRILPGLAGRPLSVIRARPGAAPFMQKNLPKHAPDWIASTASWAETSQREVRYALCDDRRTLLWFANQRAIEYHPTLIPDGATRSTELILDLDPPEDGPFSQVVAAAHLVREALAAAGLQAAVKTSGAKGLHLFVPLDEPVEIVDAFAATRALAARAAALGPDVATTAFIRADRGERVFLDPTRAGGATLVAAYSPRARPGLPVSFPVSWDELDTVAPGDFTVRTAPERLGDADPWRERMPEPRPMPGGLVEEGHTIPVPRVQAMHEGKRRKRAAAKAEKDAGA